MNQHSNRNNHTGVIEASTDEWWRWHILGKSVCVTLNVCSESFVLNRLQWWTRAGNDALHWLTTANNKKHYELRIDLADFNGTSRYAKYSEFKVASQTLKYKLISLGTYTGTAGRSIHEYCMSARSMSCGISRTVSQQEQSSHKPE